LRKIPPTLFQGAGLAAIAGLRSMAAPALLSQTLRRGDLEGLRDTPFTALGGPKVSTTLQLLMIGEMIGDKAPFVPSRTSAPGLLGRVLSGSLVGAALGAISAVAAAYVGEKLRVEATAKLGVPNPVAGLLEDSIVLFSGTRLLRKKR
jgi:uncharacterized membrane protein